MASAQGDRSQAEAVYRESLALSRQLVERLGGTPQSLEDLATALMNLADLSSGNPAHRTEAIQIYAKLVERFPDNAGYAQRLAALRGDNPDAATKPPSQPLP